MLILLVNTNKTLHSIVAMEDICQIMVVLIIGTICSRCSPDCPLRSKSWKDRLPLGTARRQPMPLNAVPVRLIEVFMAL